MTLDELFENHPEAWVVINDHIGNWHIAKRKVKRRICSDSWAGKRNAAGTVEYFRAAPASETVWVPIAKSHIHTSKEAAYTFLRKKLETEYKTVKDIIDEKSYDLRRIQKNIDKIRGLGYTND